MDIEPLSLHITRTQAEFLKTPVGALLKYNWKLDYPEQAALLTNEIQDVWELLNDTNTLWLPSSAIIIELVAKLQDNKLTNSVPVGPRNYYKKFARAMLAKLKKAYPEMQM